MSRRDASPVGAAGPPLPYPAVTLPALVLAAARRRPDAPAVRQWDESLTYRELVATAAVLAGQLRELGVGPESRVGCCLGRRPALLPAVLGVLLAGAAYVPLERSHPGQRLRHLIADAGISVVVADQAGRARLSPAPVRFVAAPAPVDRPDATAVPAGPATPDHLAHVIYTSGSTGRPKGVLTTHRNVVEFVTAFGRYTDANERMRSLGFASLGFDFVTKDLWVPLAHGGCVQLTGEADRRDPDRLARFIREHRVSWGGATPTVLAMLDPADLPEWRWVFAGGEPVPAGLVARWTAAPGGTSRRFLNTYGPTETTVNVTAAQLTGRPADPVPIGRPLPNHRAYIVDERMRPVPPGVDGELLVGGPGVARGYLGAPGLTARRFIADPFGDRPGGRLYRTGDIARWLPDGQIAFRGRRDGQLKIRGQRIELGEVEAVLLEHPTVRQAAVVPAAEPGGGTRLVAFVVATDTAGTAATDLDAIRLAAAQLLTPAMVPDRLVRVDALPRTAAGKVDRSRLAALLHAAAGAHPPADHRPGAVRSSVDIVTAEWQRVLGGAQPHPTDDFLAAGGHSVAAMRLVTGLREATGREVAVEDILTGRTVAGIAERLDRAPPAMPAGPPGSRPPTLSPGQRRLWFVDRLTPGSPANNVALAFRLDGPLHVDALRTALREVATRHEVLRWRIVERAGVPSPVCDPPGPPPLTVVDLTTVPAPDRDAALADRLAAGAAVSFDLATGPLWQVTLYQVGTDRHVLAGSWHHAVFDGWSKAVFVAELSAAYRRAIGQAAGRPVADRQLVGYAEYVAWRTDRDARRGDADLAWWVEHLHGAPTTLDIPGDRPRPATPTLHGGRVARSLPLPVTGALRRLGERLHVTTAAVLLAGFGVLLHRRTGLADMVVGAVLADRRLSRWQHVIGYLVDIAPVRVRLTDPETGTPLTFAELVHRCADELHHAAAHPAAPLERVVAALDPPRDGSRTPLVQVLFNVLNYPTPQPRLPGLRAQPVPVTVPGAPFDLTLYVVERAGAVALEAAYNADMYDESRIAALLDDAVLLLDELSGAPNRPVSAAAPPVAVATVTAPRPAAASASEPGGAPSTPTQRMVAEVWAELLGAPSIDIRENFFDLGGDSLTLLAAQARLAALTGRELPVVELFRHPNVAALAAYLDGVGAELDVARANRRAVMRRERARRRGGGAGPRTPA